MKLLLLLSMLIISYALVELLDGQAILSTIVFSLTSLVMVGISEIGISMSDPFGEDQADFNLEKFLEQVARPPPLPLSTHPSLPHLRRSRLFSPVLACSRPMTPALTPGSVTTTP